MHEDFPGGPLVKTALPMQGIWVQALVGEQIPHAVGPKKKRERE